MFTEFILSQVGERQNELIYSRHPIDKTELSDKLYTVKGTMSDKDSFFRCFRLNKDIVAAYYWKTTYPEVKSERHGLFVVIGFIFTNEDSNNMRLIIAQSESFWAALQDCFSVSFSEPYSDHFFLQLQNDVEVQITSLNPPILDIPAKKHWSDLFPIKKSFSTNFPRILYCLGESDFYMRWRLFCVESLVHIKQGYDDISTIPNTTKQSFQLLNNGDKIPENIASISVKKYEEHPYLLIF